MTPDPQLAKMHQRAQLRMLQAFQLFMIRIAYGAKPKEAIETIDEAMDAWTDYQDRYEDEHRLPELPDTTGFMMEKFQEIMDRMGTNTDRITEDKLAHEDDSVYTPEQLQNMEQEAWDKYRTALKILSTISLDSGDRASFESLVIDAEREWRSFGTAHLRLQLAQLVPDTTRADLVSEPSSDAAIQSQKGSL